MISYFLRSLGRSALQKMLSKHFGEVPLAGIVTAARDFPITSRVDVQTGLEGVLGERSEAKLLGIHSQMNHETPSFAHLFAPGPFHELGPLQHDEVDIGDPDPVRCLKNGLWLARSGDAPFAILLAPLIQFGHLSGVHVEIAIATGEAGAEFSQERSATSRSVSRPAKPIVVASSRSRAIRRPTPSWLF